MAAYTRRYRLLLLLFICSLHNGYANTIDLLATKEDVQKFLTTTLGKNGIIFLHSCVSLSVSKEIRIYRNIPDTITVIDPETYAEIIKTIQPDSSTYSTLDTIDRPGNYRFHDIDSLMNKYPLHFYKADIDGNGRTDLVVDAGILIIVMDMGNKYEGHMFSDRDDWDSYGFKKFISLPDGSIALLLRHDHNPCNSISHLWWHGKVTYVIDTVVNNTALPTSKKIDTLYKITTGVNSESQRDNGYWRTVAKEFADTVDMRLYNMTDTLVYKFHGFAKYNSSYKPAGISKIVYYYYESSDMISYNRNMCIEINKNGQCYLHYPGYRDPLNYAGQADSSSIKDLWHFTSYINIMSKKDMYRCETDHSSGCILAIYFDDGTTKTINTWAYRLPMDLSYLTKTIADLNRSIDWQYSNKRNFEIPTISSNLTDIYYTMCDCE